MSIYLSQIEPPQLISFDRESHLEDLITKIKQHPDWSSNFDGLIYHDATTMVMQLFSFLFEKNAESFDRKLRDVFLDSARSDKAKVDALREMGIDIKQNTTSVVTLQGVFQNVHILESFTIPRSTLVTASGLDSQEIKFEIIQKDSNGDYDYFNDVIIDPGQNLTSFTVQAYAGETFKHIHDLDVKSKENFIIEVPYRPIIEDSIQVYFYLNGSYFKLTEDSLIDTGKIVTGVFPNGEPKYQIKYTYDNKPLIIFGSENFGGSFADAHMLGSIVVFGRIGGGSASQIPLNTLEQTLEVDIGNGRNVNIYFTNISEATGGSDAEDIETARLYGPLRRGRGKQIVDKIDAQNAIASMIVKHKIESPSYDFEESNNVPLLHQFHWIVPTRDFRNFIFPDVDADDDPDGYAETLTDSLTDFLNVSGTHANDIENEKINDFIYYGDSYNFYKSLTNKYLLSNTLVLKAYNNNNEVIDKAKFTGNYPLLNVVYNDSQHTRTEVETIPIETIIIYSDPSERPNNNFIIKFDMEEYDFNIMLAAGTYGGEELAQALQDKIIDLIETNLNPTVLGRTSILYDVRNTHEFVTYDTSTNKIKFVSPQYGKESKIKISGDAETWARNFAEDIGVEVKTYRPDRSKLVFDGELSFFKYSTSEVFCSIVTDDMVRTDEISFNPLQDPSSPVGPVINISLWDYALEHKQMLQSATNVTVEAYKDDVRLDSMVFKNITPDIEEYYGSQNTQWTGNVFEEASQNIIKFNDSEIFLQLKNPGTPESPYIQSFDPITKIMVYKDVGGSETLVKTFTADDSWEQTSNQQDGPVIYLYPLDLEEGSKYIAKIYTNDGSGEVLTDKVTFTSIESYETEGFGDSSVVVSDDPSELPIYNKYVQRMTIHCQDGTIDPGGTDVYFAGFSEIDEIKVTYTRKNYSYITTDYTPNPYHPEQEAKDYMDIFNRKDLRLIGLENQVKDVNFIPIGIEIDVSVKKTYSTEDAKVAVRNRLIEYFGYENYNPNHDFDVIINQTEISNILVPIFGDYGITNVTLVESPTYFGEIEDEKKGYYFFLDDDMLAIMADLEDEYAQLVGLVDNLSIKINTIKVES